MDKIIETDNLCYSYDGKEMALNNLGISFERGKITTILGGNGAGKSTLFLNLNGILKPKAGTVKYSGKEIKYDKKSITDLRRKIGIVFQDPDDQLFSSSIYKDISFGAVNLGLDGNEVKRRVEEAMRKVNIFDLKDRPTHELSFGQKKRAAIAGALVMKPEVIILDEPTAGLDPMSVSRIMKMLEGICRKDGTTIVLSTHDIDVVPVYSDYVYVMEKGSILIHGAPEEIFKEAQILREHDLRLPRIAHLLEILKKEDGFEVDFSNATIGRARREILSILKK